jgi:hypothetical protein
MHTLVPRLVPVRIASGIGHMALKLFGTQVPIPSLPPLRMRAFMVPALLMFLLMPGIPLQAQTDAAIWGRVIDQATGEPLRKVRVVLRPAEIQTVTDDQGNYRLRSIPPGSYVLQVSTIGYRLLKKDVRLEEGESREIVFDLGQESTTIQETVVVKAPVFEEAEKVATSQIALNSTELRNLTGVLLDDPLRSVQTLPGVATGDDFNMGYSIRGGSFENNGIMVDGVLTHNLAHAVQDTQDPFGSVTVMNGDLVESMALYSGAFSSKYGDRTASFLDIVTREGSRDYAHVRLAVSGSNAALVAEGPLGSAKKGAWITSFRKSYAGYLVDRISREADISLGFTDTQGKANYDLGNSQRLTASFIWGTAGMSRNPANRGVTSIIEAHSRVGIGNFSWTWMPSSRLFWESRVYIIRETFDNTNKDNQLLGRGGYTEGAARSDFSWLLPAGQRIEGGFLSKYATNVIQNRRYDSALRQFIDFENPRARYWQHAGYIQDCWKMKGAHLNLTIGARFESTGLTGQMLAHPHASLEWRWSKSNKLDAGWGVYSQFPEVLQVLGRNGDRNLHAELARHYVLGYEYLLGEKSRIRVEWFERQDSNLVRDRDNLYRIANGKVTAPDLNFHYDNALKGNSRGVEVYFQRRSANRLAGWISYSYSVSRRRDLITGEEYTSEYDQRHTMNLYGSYRFSDSWNLSAKARLGSGFPYPGYFEIKDADFYLITVRNASRLPWYSREDVRLSKAFYFKHSKLSLYIEVLNIFNRNNLRYDRTSSVNATTRKVSMSRDSLLPILPTAGFVLEF